MRKQPLLGPAFAVLAVGVGAGVPAAALAQDRIPAATGSSESAAFRQQGFDAGGFRLYPTLRLSTEYDDNVSRSNDNKSGDGSFVIAPSVSAQSNWSSNQLDANAYYRSTQYFERTDQNHDEYGANASGRLDVQRTTKLSGSAGYARQSEQRGTPGDLFFSNQLIRYSIFNANGQIYNQFNRLGLTGGVGTRRYRYNDVDVNGVTVDQTFRDRNVNSVNGRAEYQYSAISSFYITGSYNSTDYNRPLASLDRSSSGFTALAGVRFELSRLLRGQIAVGYIKQRFSDPRFADFSGLNYDVSLNYQPTALTSVSLTAGRHLTDSALASVVGVLTHDVNININHELLRNLYLQGGVGYTHYTYRGIDRNDNRYDISLGARYRMNRFVSAALSGSHVSQDSGDILARAYSSNRGSLSLVLTR